MVKPLQFSLAGLMGVVLYAAAWFWALSRASYARRIASTIAFLLIGSYAITKACGSNGEKRAFWSAFMITSGFVYFVLKNSGDWFWPDDYAMSVAQIGWMMERRDNASMLVAFGVAVAAAFAARSMYRGSHHAEARSVAK